MTKQSILAAGIFIVSACSVDVAPENGRQACSETATKRCADGFYCAMDGFCWREGTGPNETSTVDGSLPEDAAPVLGVADAIPPDAFVPHTFIPSPSGRAVVPGGVRMKSTNYRAVVTVGQAPGGNRTSRSANYQFIGGLVGSIGDLEKE
ncbi:MAG: hypothetical protein KA712_12020 [Myxococcales bacterium]|nr:hypothetical protein [Myxococcales bacterium]